VAPVSPKPGSLCRFAASGCPAAHPNPLGAEEPGAGRRLRQRGPLRRRSVRASHREHPHGRTARGRPEHGEAGPRTSTPGRTRRMPPSTAGCGGLPTSRAAHSAWPPSSATARHADNPAVRRTQQPGNQWQEEQPDPTRTAPHGDSAIQSH
jgi:hypothetical protein